MWRFNSRNVLLVILLSGSGLALANPTVDQQPLGPDGQLYGGSLSPKGLHVAVLAAKGSHYQIIMDGAAGPLIDSLIFNVTGSIYRPSMYGNAPIPVIFSKDGAHWAYMAKQGDDYVVMLDGKEFARGPINTRGQASSLNLTFSANGQHLFWSDTDAQGKFVIVADGKTGPPSLYLPQLIISPDGNHYAYVSINRDGTGAWAFVDGRQVNYFGDNLQYTAKNVLLSTMHSPDNNNIFVINGKPEIKAYAFNQTWISPDGKQIAMLITPKNGDPTALLVNGKMIAGTEGVRVSSVYFSADGKRYAALCSTKTGDQYMIIDGKKGAAYPSISPQLASQNMPHWQYVTWGQTVKDLTQFEPSVPGFTADSSKFVYVASSNGRGFLVIDDQESDAYSHIYPVLSPMGNRIGAYGLTPDNTQHVLIDGKDTSYGIDHGLDRTSGFTFSPQGTHYVYVRQLVVYLDNVAQPGLLQGNFVFSSDDKHLAYEADNNGHPSLFVDGKNFCDKPGRVDHIFFSPDNNHIYWVNSGNLPVTEGIQTKDSYMLYVDGKPATHFADNAVALDPGNDGWATLHPEYAADDTMTFIARTDGNIRRFRVKSDTDLASVLAAAPAPKAN
jgi:hypothetical protein